MARFCTTLSFISSHLEPSRWAEYSLLNHSDQLDHRDCAAISLQINVAFKRSPIVYGTCSCRCELWFLVLRYASGRQRPSWPTTRDMTRRAAGQICRLYICRHAATALLAQWNVVAAFELSENSWVEYINTNTNNNVFYYNRSDALKDNDNVCVEDMLF